MNGRTVTIETGDHGPVTVPEPQWCTGEGHDLAHAYRVDIGHIGVEHRITVRTVHGERELLTLGLAQHPYTELPSGTAVHVAVQLLDGDSYPFTVPDLAKLADDLAAAASRVRLVARRLAVETALGGGR